MGLLASSVLGGAGTSVLVDGTSVLIRDGIAGQGTKDAMMLQMGGDADAVDAWY